jgi:hypothetical protein
MKGEVAIICSEDLQQVRQHLGSKLLLAARSLELEPIASLRDDYILNAQFA